MSDFILFNFLFVVLHVPLFVANIIAVSIVMTLSLYLNRRFVFATGNTDRAQATRFIVTTMIGLYLIQNIVIFVALHLLDGAHMLTGMLANDVLQANIAKAIGVAGSATWNFMIYKLWVFKKPVPEPEAHSE